MRLFRFLQLKPGKRAKTDIAQTGRVTSQDVPCIGAEITIGQDLPCIGEEVIIDPDVPCIGGEIVIGEVEDDEIQIAIAHESTSHSDVSNKNNNNSI